MGCICAGESDIENFLTEFIDELNIRRYNGKTYLAHLEKENSSPFKNTRTNYDDFLRSNQNVQMHEKYQENLYKRPHHHFYLALIFLIQHDNAKKMSESYKQVQHKLKTSYEEQKKETLADFFKTDNEILRDILNFYVKMISLDVIVAAQESKENKDRLTPEQLKVLKTNYGLDVIALFVKEDLMKDCKNPVNLEEFFTKNHMKLKHPTVRENLRRWYENYNTISKTVKKETNAVNKQEENLVSRQKPNSNFVEKQVITENKNGIQGGEKLEGDKYAYKLPEINDYSNSNQGSNNYNKIQKDIVIDEDDMECVQSGNPGVGNYGNSTTYGDYSNSNKNYGSNNYNKIQKDIVNDEDDMECVQSGNPGVGNYGNSTSYGGDYNRGEAEAEILKKEQYAIYRRECLIHHNKIRERHGVPPLRESESLSEYSQQWANFISDTDSLTHSSMIWDSKNVGENIAKAGAVINDPSQLIVHKWYEEKENYDYSNPSSQNNTKNFSQMVWRNTESIGFGLSYSQSGNTFIVINYHPAGNVADEYRKNITEARD